MTVAELTAAVAVLGILASMAGSGIVRTLDRCRFRAAPRQIYVELQRARMAAVSENNRYRFSLVGGSDRLYEIHDDDDGDGVEDAGERVVTGDVQYENPDVAITVSGAIVFAPNGTAPGSGTVTLASGHGQSAAIQVSSTGRIRIQ